MSVEREHTGGVARSSELLFPLWNELTRFFYYARYVDASQQPATLLDEDRLEVLGAITTLSHAARLAQW